MTGRRGATHRGVGAGGVAHAPTSSYLPAQRAVAPLLNAAGNAMCYQHAGLRIFSRVGYLKFLELTGFAGWWVGVGELWI